MILRYIPPIVYEYYENVKLIVTQIHICSLVRYLTMTGNQHINSSMINTIYIICVHVIQKGFHGKIKTSTMTKLQTCINFYFGSSVFQWSRN